MKTKFLFPFVALFVSLFILHNCSSPPNPGYEITQSIDGPYNESGLKQVVLTVRADSMYSNNLNALASELENEKHFNEFRFFYIFPNTPPEIDAQKFKDIIEVRRFCKTNGAIGEISVSNTQLISTYKIKGGEVVFE